MSRIGTIFVGLLVCCTSAAMAQPTLTVEAGWGGKFRPVRWNPIFVTVSDIQPRNVYLELSVADDRSSSMRIRQGFAVGPVPTTYPLFSTLSYDLEQTHVTLRDAKTGRKIADASPSLLLTNQYSNVLEHAVGDQDVMIGVSGTGPAVQTLAGQVGDTAVAVGYLPAARLPAVAMGYNCLDVLALNQPNLDPASPDPSHLSNDQQHAIMDWVRAGGNLVLWPGDDPLPAVGPIVNALPCRIRDTRMYDVTEGSGVVLPANVTRLKGRALAPSDDAVEMDLPTGITAYRRRVGFGQIVVLPINASSLRFDNTAGAMKFWRPILDALVELPKDEKTKNQPRGWYYQQDQRRYTAVSYGMDLIGAIPGLGRFDFSYVAIVLIGMMLIVGPVDWFVLKRLGRQPWTWVTTSGWILLITLGSITLGRFIKSGDLHFRTLRVTDQADGATTATTELLCVYSPRTRDYELAVDPQGWWKPPHIGPYYHHGGNGMMDSDLYAQDYRGNRPGKMRINVWNIRFTQGTTIAAGPKLIDADLSLRPATASSPPRIVGTIMNTGPAPISDLRVRSRLGVAKVEATVAPGASVPVDLPMQADFAQFLLTPTHGQPYSISPTSAYGAGCDLALERSRTIERLLGQSDELVCIYAQAQGPATAHKLKNQMPIEKHWQFIRALVRVK